MLSHFMMLALQSVVPAHVLPAADTLDPFAPLIAEVWLHNGLLESARYTEAGAAAQVREARALYLPSLNLQSRHSELNGTTNLGDFVNPAYRALNQLTGTSQFPTNIDLTLPQAHDTYLRFAVPIVNPAIWANHSAARHSHDVQRYQRLTLARRLAADVQIAWLSARSAQAAVVTREAAVELVQENLRVSERRVNAGTVTPDAVFRARAELSEAEQQLIEARDAASQAMRVVNQLAGRPFDTPLDLVPDSALLRDLPVSRADAVASALDRREELAGLQSGSSAAKSQGRAARASFFPTVALAVDYGFQGRDLSFNSRNDYWVASLVVSWNLFNGGGDAARIDAAEAASDALQAQYRDATEKVQLEVLQSYDAALAARQAITAADDQLAAARQAYLLVSRRYQEGMASQVELIDARTTLTSAELNQPVTLYRYARRLVELERAAALRVLGQ